MVQIYSRTHLGAPNLIMACFLPKDILGETLENFVVF